MRRDELLVTVVAVIFCSALYVAITDPKTHADEFFHYNQVARFIVGNPRINSMLTTFPTYNYILAIPGKLYRPAGNLPFVRFFAFCLSALSILAFYRLAASLEPASAQLRTLQYCFLPILFPLIFLIYTDLFSFAFIFAAFYFVREGRYTLAGISAICAVAVRQNNIIWVFFCSMMILHREEDIRTALKRGWLFILLFLGFGAFVWLNHGVAIGDRGMHPSGIYTGNIFFMLLLFFILFLPLHVAKAREIVGYLKEHKFTWLLIPILYLVYIYTFSPTHPYNLGPEHLFFLRNRLLFVMNSSLLSKTIFFIPIAYSVLTLMTIELKERQFYWIYPASILFVMPAWLIEQRYYLIPFSLFLLTRKQENLRIEYLLLALWVPCALFLFYGAITGLFFL